MRFASNKKPRTPRETGKKPRAGAFCDEATAWQIVSQFPTVATTEKAPTWGAGALTGRVVPGIVRSATNRRCDYSISHCPPLLLCGIPLNGFGRRPRRDSLRTPAGGGPSRKPGGFTARSRGPFTDKPGARKAGGAERRNRNLQIAQAIGPRNGFLIRRSPPPGRAWPTARHPEKGRQRGRLVL